jgi:hypothetical protein
MNPEVTEEADKALTELIAYYVDKPITKELVDDMCVAILEWGAKFNIDIYD